MQFSNDGASWPTIEAYAASKASWDITVPPHTVGHRLMGLKPFIRNIRDSAGNWSASVSDTITLDATPPTETITINSGTGSTNASTVTLALTCDDGTGSGCSQMKFSNDNATWSNPEAVNSAKSWGLSAGDGPKTVYVKYSDIAGNWSNAIMPMNLVSWWQGEGNANDQTGLNNGTLNGVTFAAGKAGQAFSFNGSSNILLPDAIVPSTSRNFSVSAWVNPADTNVTANGRMIFYGGANSGEYALNYNSTGKYQFGVKLTDGNWYFTGTFTPAAGTWNYLLGIRNGTQIELWVDGVLQATATIPDLDRNVTGGYGTRIGSVSFNTAYWVGMIDRGQDL